LLSKASLTDEQRQLVDYFKPYTLDKKNTPIPKPVKLPTRTLLRNFDPETSVIDRRILFEITGRKIQEDDAVYSDEDGDQKPKANVRNPYSGQEQFDDNRSLDSDELFDAEMEQRMAR